MSSLYEFHIGFARLSHHNLHQVFLPTYSPTDEIRVLDVQLSPDGTIMMADREAIRQEFFC